MSDSEAIDYPPANIVNNQNKINDINDNENEYPIIRCENCKEILLMSLDLDKNEILLACEKDRNNKRISLKNFFDNINKYKDFNCCQLCIEENLSQKYYLCKTCSNKIICKKCYEKHNKDDNIENLSKIDSLCRKHFNQIESFCDICKENKCSYCIPEHEEEHKNKEYLIRDKLFKKNKLDTFKNNLKNISEIKQNIEMQINDLINELKKKIELLNDLKNKFFDKLNMKIKFTNLVYQNYFQKFKNTDLNYYLIKNLESQIDFNLQDLKINNENKLENKVEQIITYLNSNINNHFNNKSENNFYEEGNNNINEVNINAIDVNYKIERQFEFNNIIGFIDFNEDLYAIYNLYEIKFISKNENIIKFEINEKDLYEIKSCQRNEDNKILILTNKYLIFIKILENSDYIILNKYSLSLYKFEFNSSLSLLYSDSYSYSERIYIRLFPNYKEEKKLLDYYNYIEKFQFVKDNLFFIFEQNKISSYLIKNNKVEFLNSKNQINIDKDYSEIIDLNKSFYLLNNKDKIYLLNKNNLNLNKTISIKININKYEYISKSYDNYFYSNKNNYFTSLFKISDKIISLFIFYNNWAIDFQNYHLSMSGIKWELKKENTLLINSFNSLKRYNNKLLILGEYNSFLIRMTNNKNDNKESNKEIDIKEINDKENNIKEDKKENESYYSNCIIS